MGSCSQNVLIGIGLLLETGYGTLEEFGYRKGTARKRRFLTSGIDSNTPRDFDRYSVVLIVRTDR